jgi:hypothetical protein
MDLKRLFNKAKQTIDDRGGVGSLKEDAEELKGVAKGKGSLTDKAKRAAEAVKEPGAPGGKGEGREKAEGREPKRDAR